MERKSRMPNAERQMPASQRRFFLWHARIYYEDTDAGGVTYYANYLRFAERARSEALREIGFAHGPLLADAGLLFVVRRAEIDYLFPARLDDLLQIETEIVRAGAATLDMRQIMRLEEAGSATRAASGQGDDLCGRVLVEAKIKLATVTPEGKVCRMSSALRKAFEG